MSAARVASARPSGSCRRTRASCSSGVVYRSWRATPRSTQAGLRNGRALAPSITVRCGAYGSEGPLTGSIRSTVHGPPSPPTKLVWSGLRTEPPDSLSTISVQIPHVRGAWARPIILGARESLRPHRRFARPLAGPGGQAPNWPEDGTDRVRTRPSTRASVKTYQGPGTPNLLELLALGLD